MSGQAPIADQIDKLIHFWASEAEEALKVAGHLVEKEDFSYALFFGHLALEKILKALCVKEQRDHAPPIHNLVRLAKIAGIERIFLMKEALRLDDRIEPSPFRPEDFSPDNPLVNEISSSGIEISTD